MKVGGDGYGSNGAPAVDPEELDRLKKLSLRELLEGARLGAIITLLLNNFVISNSLLIIGIHRHGFASDGRNPLRIGFPDKEAHWLPD
jgi:hypothetical protein